MTNQEIKTVGQTIAQETQIGGNTAARVGGVIEGIGVALDNKDAANGYYQATISGGTITVNAPNYLLGSGGNLRIKMPSAGTTASTLTIGNANAVQLWYNGAAVSAQNTWEANEIISVFYDGTRFMASNSQGGGGKFASGEKVNETNVEHSPIQESNNLITSGAVYSALSDIGKTNPVTFKLDISGNWKQGKVEWIDGSIGTSTKDAYTKLFYVKGGNLRIVCTDDMFIEGVFTYKIITGGSTFDKCIYQNYQNGAWDSSVKDKTFHIDDRLVRIRVGRYPRGTVSDSYPNNRVSVYLTENRINQKTITPELDYENLAGNIGTYPGDEGGDFIWETGNTKYLSTCRFVKTNRFFEIISEYNCQIGAIFYDSNFKSLGYANWVNVEAGIPISVNPSWLNNSGNPYLARFDYVKIRIRTDSSASTVPLPQIIKFIGVFEDDWDIFNVRPYDSGYHAIKVNVNITDPNCCDDEGTTVQDSGAVKYDWGVICLPERYQNIGKPTRLIIYCHGAAVNYNANANRFDRQELEPNYWLSEGYAVMDVEGNPFDNSNKHYYIPQAMECYIAAYNWAIRHYNLKKDGVFIGGRSMGGGMVFDLIKNQCAIPVIAACPNVPSNMSFGTMGVDTKAFISLHSGFVLPEGFSWGNTYNSTEKSVCLSNWDKLIKTIPIINLTTDLPVSNEFKENFVNNLYLASDERTNIWGALHAVAKCPVKLFGCEQDQTCPPAKTSGLYYKMLMNAAQLVELRIYDEPTYVYPSSTSGHHYDTQNPNLRATVTTRYGETLANIPIVYIEMLRFWRRYEQN